MVAHTPTIKPTYKLNTCILFQFGSSFNTWLIVWHQFPGLTFTNLVYFIQKLYCILWTDQLVPQNTNSFLFLETLAAYPWSCMCCTSHRQIIDSPSLQPHRCWLVSWDTCMCWRLPLKWMTAQQDNGRHDTFEDPCLHPDRNWGSSFLHLYTTEDPPFCTCYKQKEPKSCNVIGHRWQKWFWSKNARSGADPI